MNKPVVLFVGRGDSEFLAEFFDLSIEDIQIYSLDKKPYINCSEIPDSKLLKFFTHAANNGVFYKYLLL